MGNEFDQEKVPYLKKLRQQLEDWRSGVDLLRTKAGKTVEKARRKYDREIVDLVKKYTKAGAKFTFFNITSNSHSVQKLRISARRSSVSYSLIRKIMPAPRYNPMPSTCRSPYCLPSRVL